MTRPDRGQAGRECDECHRGRVKIARVHRGERYCQTCYQRMFKRRMCTKCGNFARLPRFEPDAICLKCENARPCVRCGRKKYRTGMRTPYGPACIPCSAYFKAPEPCEACGEESRWLSRSKQLGHDLRVCPRCARANHRTCEACRRHRPLEASADGRKLCRACREQGEVPCPECGRLMPAGCGERCWECYWAQLARRRTELYSAGLASPALGKRFVDFSTWLLEKTGGRKTALNLYRYLEFFQEIERAWEDIPEYAKLLERFGARELRRHPLATRWMEESGLITINAKMREEDSDRRRIEATLNLFPAGSTERDLLDEYRNALHQRVQAGALSVRSMRLALTPAAGLLKTAAQRQRMPPDQKTLDRFLREKPGQAAALSGFVSHLRQTRAAELTIPNRSARARDRARRDKLRPEMLALMQKADNTKPVDRRWVELALQYFHDLPAHAGSTVTDAEMTQDADGWSVTFKGQRYWIPSPTRSTAPTR